MLGLTMQAAVIEEAPMTSAHILYGDLIGYQLRYRQNNIPQKFPLQEYI
jgi:hypothetical protein